ncbi:hypothetical protein A9Q86_11935 [Flavobacteriales bacterium 33_180_T64]|nr:hypothetical protein A9Q86_11935 [Flavobacteriales bacterium 33_180_T64]
MAEVKTLHRIESKSPFLSPNESFFIEFKPLEGIFRVRADRTVNVGTVFKNNSPFNTKQPTFEEFLVFDPLKDSGPAEDISIKVLGGIKIDISEPISNTNFSFITKDFISSTNPIFNETAKNFIEFAVSKLLENRKWKCTFTNITQENSKCKAQLRFPFNKVEIKETRIPRRLLNRTFNTLLLSLGLQVFARKGSGNIFVDKDFEHLINGSISKEIKFPDSTLFSVEKFELKDFIISANQIPPNHPELPVRPLIEIEFDFESDIEIGIPVFNANISNINIKLGFILNVMQSTSNEGDGNMISPLITIDVKVEGEESIPFFELKDIEKKIKHEIFMPLQPISVKREISKYLTKGLMELAERGDVFWDITSDNKDYIVKHIKKPKFNIPGIDTLLDATDNVFVDATNGAGGQSGGNGNSGGFNQPNISFPGTVGATTVGVSPVNPTDSTDPVEDPSGLNNLDKIDHIVVLMMENRSFDHMLGYLTINGNNDIDGITGNESNINPITQSPVKQEPLRDKTFRFSPHHEHQHVLNQIDDGTMQGFLADFMGRFPEINPLFGMGFYNEEKLKVYDFLAKEYTVCNKWFCSHPGPTFPNRICTLTGKIPELDNFAENDPRLGYLKETTIFDTLTANNKSWAFFEQDMTALRMFDKYRLDDKNILPLYKENDARDEYSSNEVFFSRVQNGNLPQVTFLDPNFVDLPPQKTANDDHPPANVENGQEFIKDVYNALANSPQWEKTMFIITYDEHGGFYDHVAPPGTKASLEGENSIPKIHKDGPEFYGPRVPAFVISAWTEASPTNIIFDHTSIIKTILTKFNNGIIPDEYGERVKQANHLGPLLSREIPISTPKIIAPINSSNTTSFIESPDEHIVDSGGSEFHSVLQHFAIPK